MTNHHNSNKRGAGVFIYDPITDAILLVQSWGRKWGPPKGHCDSDAEPYEACALRELLEETGFSTEQDKFQKCTRVYRYKIYFSELDQETHNVFKNLDKEITGIQWYPRTELMQLILTRRIKMNIVGIISFERFLKWKGFVTNDFRFFAKKSKRRI